MAHTSYDLSIYEWEPYFVPFFFRLFIDGLYLSPQLYSGSLSRFLKIL
jgi:hypothetical protein